MNTPTIFDDMATMAPNNLVWVCRTAAGATLAVYHDPNPHTDAPFLAVARAGWGVAAARHATLEAAKAAAAAMLEQAAAA